MVGSNFVVFLSLALFSEAVGTIVGFGSTTILIPLASFDIEKKRYLGTAAAIGLGADIVRVLVYKQTELLK